MAEVVFDGPGVIPQTDADKGAYAIGQAAAQLEGVYRVRVVPPSSWYPRYVVRLFGRPGPNAPGVDVPFDTELTDESSRDIIMASITEGWNTFRIDVS